MHETRVACQRFSEGNCDFIPVEWDVDIAQLRQEYMRSGLAESQADADPMRQFERWMAEAIAADLPLPNAMTLATVGASGRPSARIVLLKGIDRGAFVFYTNFLSRKGRELERHASACLLFLWAPLERQVRIDGAVEKVAAADADAYFASRPLGARLSAWASAQSEPVPGRETLEEALAAARLRHGGEPPRPPHWGGYRVLPAEIEFWQGRADRLHDRLVYRRKGSAERPAWTIERLSP
jgi:pyridoxamine 5'-phosphate oxidase